MVNACSVMQYTGGQMTDNWRDGCEGPWILVSACCALLVHSSMQEGRRATNRLGQYRGPWTMVSAYFSALGRIVVCGRAGDIDRGFWSVILHYWC